MFFIPLQCNFEFLKKKEKKKKEDFHFLIFNFKPLIINSHNNFYPNI